MGIVHLSCNPSRTAGNEGGVVLQSSSRALTAGERMGAEQADASTPFPGSTWRELLSS